MTDGDDYKFPKIQTMKANNDAIKEFRRAANYLTGYVRSIDQAMAGIRAALNADFLKIHQAAMEAVKGWTFAMQGTVNDP